MREITEREGWARLDGKLQVYEPEQFSPRERVGGGPISEEDSRKRTYYSSRLVNKRSKMKKRDQSCLRGKT